MALADITPKPQNKNANAKNALRWAALFLGELREGLTMVWESTCADCDIRISDDAINGVQ